MRERWHRTARHAQVAYIDEGALRARIHALWERRTEPQVAAALAQTLLCQTGPLHPWNDEAGRGLKAAADGAVYWCQRTTAVRADSADFLAPLPRELALHLDLSELDPGRLITRRHAMTARDTLTALSAAVHGWLTGGHTQRYAGLHDVSLKPDDVWRLLAGWQQGWLPEPVSWPDLPFGVAADAVIGARDEQAALQIILDGLRWTTIDPQWPLARLIAYHNRVVLGVVLRLEASMGTRPAAVTTLRWDGVCPVLEILDKGASSERILPLPTPVLELLQRYRAHVHDLIAVLGPMESRLAVALQCALTADGPLFVGCSPAAIALCGLETCPPTPSWRRQVCPELIGMADQVGRHCFETGMSGTVPHHALQAWLGRGPSAIAAPLVADQCHLGPGFMAALCRYLESRGWCAWP